MTGFRLHSLGRDDEVWKMSATSSIPSPPVIPAKAGIQKVVAVNRSLHSGSTRLAGMTRTKLLTSVNAGSQILTHLPQRLAAMAEL
jgi:hypothetical protein